MTDSIEWAEPPPRRNSLDKYVALREALRARPGEWAVLKRDAAQSYSTQIIQRPAWAGFETTARTQENGRFTVYVRYVGEVTR